MAKRLIESLPFSDDEGSARIPNGPVVPIGHNQIILWVSITLRRPPFDAEGIIPPGTRRFPAVLDTGYNDGFLLNERHLQDWALLDPSALPSIASWPPVTIKGKLVT